MMGFELSEYSFNESAGSLPASVYIVRENTVTVSSNFSVIVVLQNYSTATYGKLLQPAVQPTLFRLIQAYWYALHLCMAMVL